MLKFRVGSAVHLVLSEPGLKENGSSTSRHVVQIAINSGLVSIQDIVLHVYKKLICTRFFNSRVHTALPTGPILATLHMFVCPVCLLVVLLSVIAYCTCAITSSPCMVTVM